MARAKQQTSAILKVYAYNVGVRFVKDDYRPKRRLTLRVTCAGRGRLPDKDNLQKILLDSAKMAGLIVDDSPEWLEFPQPFVGRGKQTTTFILIEDV